MTLTWFHRLGSPPFAYELARRLTPWLAWPAAILIAYALYMGLFVVPQDYQQGEGYRIIFIHAPSAWLSRAAFSVR